MNGLGRKNQNNEKKQSIFTRETFGVVTILFSTLCLICLITGDALFSTPGGLVSAFLFGCFGFFAYAVISWAIVIGVLLVCDKKINISLKRKVLFTLGFSLIALLSHVISMSGESYTYGEYLSASYLKGAGGIQTVSGGGIFTGLIAYVFSAILTNIGCYVVLSIAIIATGYFLTVDFIKNKNIFSKDTTDKFKSSYVKDTNDAYEIDGVKFAGEMEYPISNVDFNQKSTQKLFVNNPQNFALKTKREMAKDTGAGIKIDFSNDGIAMVNTTDSYTKTFSDELRQKIDYVKTPPAIDVKKTINNDKYDSFSSYNTGTSVSSYVTASEGQPLMEEKVEEIPCFEHEGNETILEDSAQSHAERFASSYAEIKEVDEVENFVEPQETYHPVSTEISVEEIKAEDMPSATNREEIFRAFSDKPIEEQNSDNIETIEKIAQEEIEELPPVSSIIRERTSLFGNQKEQQIANTSQEENFANNVSVQSGFESSRTRIFDIGKDIEDKVEPEVINEIKPKKPAPPINREYKKPPFDLLETYSAPINAGQENHQERMEIIQRTLEEFHINAVPQNYVQGPSITRYEIMMPAGVSVKKVLSYDDDLKMRLAAKDGVRIEAPIPGKNLVGIEVANTVKTMVGFREVMEGLSASPKKGSLIFAIGKDIIGNSISYDLSKGPHYLVAGATGSGKSVCLHVMLVSLLMRYSPEELKLVLVDPKGVEFRKYEHIPHLLVDEIITEPKRVLTLLQWAYEETTRRNDMFTACGGEISNIDDYNSIIASDTVPKLPRIVFFIDELADLMESCKKDLEARIRMIAAKSRSAGIHLVLATQRPSVDVITGTIKANLPSRIALKVTNFTDSQIILNENGAEKLLGNGDMLYKDLTMSNYERYQGAYISGREITNIVNYIKNNNTAYFDDDVQEFLDKETKPKQEDIVAEGVVAEGANNENDALFKKALWLAVTSGNISISALQRRFRVGYARAGAMVDDMERKGYISANEGSKARRVILTREEFINKFGPIEDDGY